MGNTSTIEVALMDDQRVLWLAVKRALLLIVAAIDARYGKETRPA